jgi:hypothetical protein
MFCYFPSFPCLVQLLTFLLDGLSEDLNLVHDKPYVEQPDSDERPDSELAQIWWENHLKREHSVMQSLFTGQFKSVTRCVQEACSYHSARFEPFNMLSLPLPDDELRVMAVHVVTREAELPVRCAVRVKKSSGAVGDIEAALRTYDIPGLHEVGCCFLVLRLQNGKVAPLRQRRQRGHYPRDRRPLLLSGARLIAFNPLSVSLSLSYSLILSLCPLTSRSYPRRRCC